MLRRAVARTRVFYAPQRTPTTAWRSARDKNNSVFRAQARFDALDQPLP